MVAVAEWFEYNGVAPVATKIAGIRFGSKDEPELDVRDYPILQGNCSFDKFIKIHFTNVVDQITNIKLFRSTSDGLDGPEKIADGVTLGGRAGYTNDLSYVAPSASDKNLDELPHKEIEGLPVGPDPITTDGYTFYIQLQIYTDAECEIDLKDFYLTIRWDETSGG